MDEAMIPATGQHERLEVLQAGDPNDLMMRYTSSELMLHATHCRLASLLTLTQTLSLTLTCHTGDVGGRVGGVEHEVAAGHGQRDLLLRGGAPALHAPQQLPRDPAEAKPDQPAACSSDLWSPACLRAMGHAPRTTHER